MKTPEEKRWELMQNYLLAEYSGDAQPALRSTRTLFGIKSYSEEVIERTVRDMESAKDAPLNSSVLADSLDSHETSPVAPTVDYLPGRQREDAF